MKKIYSIFAAGVLALLALSCVKESQAVFDISKASAPVLGSYELGEEAITATYTPATFKMGFNEKIAPNHTLALVSLDGQKVSKTLTTSDKDGILTLKNVNLAKALMTLGKAEGSTASVELAVRASAQDPSKDNGRNGYVDSDGHITISSFEVVIPEIVGSPYADYTEASDWSVIGSLSAYEISWDGDLNMWTDGNNHVAAHVKLAAGDEFKFRKDQDWAVNYGGDFGSLDTEFGVSQDGPNIKVGADGIYDLYLNPTDGTAWITAAYDPLPDFTEASTWSVIGALSIEGISWDGDIAMISDGTWHVALGVNLAADDEFKYRQDASWTVNLGGDFGGLANEFAVSQDGPNIKVGAAGSFDLYVNPADGLAKVTEASGAKVSAKIGGGGEEPGPEPVTGWNIIGLNGDWDNDIRATEDNGVWTAYITAEGDTEFKWRKDGGWDENFGGVMEALGEPFDAVAGGDNVKIGAGFWKVVLNTNDGTITVSNGQVWSLIGVNGDWNTDIDMVLADGKWVSPVTKINGEFKLRENHGWDNNRGGDFVAVGEPIAAAPGGNNINVPEGNYIVTYDPEAETIVIDETGWGLVGTINGWGNTPDIILKEEGLFLVAKNVALTDSDEIKIRYKSSWDENRGGATSVGHAVKAVPGGDNIKPGVAGNYDVWYRPDSEVIFVMPAGTELAYWGVVGTINGWGAPDRIMYENAAGQFVFEDLEITATDEIKIRKNEDWADNRGGSFSELGEAFAVEGNGANIKVGRDAKVTVTYDPTAETITLAGEYQGDAPSKPAAWSLIGTLSGSSWDKDFDLQNTSGDTWVIKNVTVTAADEFKIRADHDWATSVGGPEGNDASIISADNPYDVYKPELGKAFTAGDKNIHIGVEGAYTITFDYAANTILVEAYQEFPEHLYMIGEEFGNWDWSSDGIVEMIPVLHHPDWGADAPGQFWTVRYIHAGKGFKFCSQRAWNGDFWGLQTNDGFTEAGGNCTVAEDGFYMIHVDFKNGKVHVEPARIYGIGDLFGGWNEEMSGSLFAKTDGAVSVTIPADGNLRMYAASTISTSPWWTREFDVIGGKIVYRGVGDELAAVPVTAGQKVTLDFNAGTGTIE